MEAVSQNKMQFAYFVAHFSPKNLVNLSFLPQNRDYLHQENCCPTFLENQTSNKTWGLLL